ncbi:MAG: hypothetical protein AAFU38_10825 [Bacteroidota bacterium]
MLGLLREYAWQHRVSGLMFSSDEVALAEKALGRVNPAPHALELDAPDLTLDGSLASDDLPEGVNWESILDDWETLALSVLADARRNLDAERFEKWKTQLSRLALSSEGLHRFHYEVCQFALSRLKTEEARIALNEWPDASGAFTHGLVWRARVEAEIGLWDRAVQSCQAVLARIERAQGSDSHQAYRSVALKSAEGWARQFLAYAEQVSGSLQNNRVSPDFSWQRALSILGANPREILDELSIPLKADPPALPKVVTKKRKFDPGSTSPSYSLRWGMPPGYEDFRSGQRLLAAYEEGGMPLGAPGFIVPQDVERACVWTRLSHPSYALAVELQAGSDTALDYLTRARIGAFDEGFVDALYVRTWQGTRANLQELEKLHPLRVQLHIAKRLVLSAEVISRLVFRFDEERHREALGLGRELLRFPSERIRYELAEVAGKLIKRGMEGLSEPVRNEEAIELLQLPVPGLDFDTAHPRRWPNIGRLLTLGMDAGFEASIPPRLVEELIRKLESAPDTTTEGGNRVAWRLLFLARRGHLTSDEHTAFASTLWGENGLMVDDGNGLLTAYLARTPGPNQTRAREAVRDFAFSNDRFGSKGMQTIRVASELLYFDLTEEQYDEPMSWSASDAQQMLTKVEEWFAWAKDEGRNTRPIIEPLVEARNLPQPVLLMAEAVLAYLDPADEATQIRAFRLLSELQESRVPIGRALPLLADACSDETRSSFYAEFAAPEEERVAQAAWGIASWMVRHEKGLAPSVPDPLIAELIYAASVKREGQRKSLRALASGLEASPTIKLESFHRRRLSDALSELLSRVQLPPGEEAATLPPSAVPECLDELASAGARLASVLLRRTTGSSPEEPDFLDKAVDRWAEFAVRSPFPEVRRAFSVPAAVT